MITLEELGAELCNLCNDRRSLDYIITWLKSNVGCELNITDELKYRLNTYKTKRSNLESLCKYILNCRVYSLFEDPIL